MAAVPLVAADTKENIALSIVLDGLENRYNRAKTLQVSFEESYMGSGRPTAERSGRTFASETGQNALAVLATGRKAVSFRR